MKIKSGAETNSVKIFDDNGRDITLDLRVKAIQIKMPGPGSLVTAVIECNLDEIEIDVASANFIMSTNEA